MTSDFDLNNHSPASNSQNSSSGSSSAVQRDRFELLSAYLDGEVTAAERQQVEGWLATDPMMQRLHSRLLKLRQGFQNLPVPAPQQSVEKTVEAVFARVERRPRRSLIWGGAAIAAVLVGAVTTVFSMRGPVPQMAESPQKETQARQPKQAEPLLIALDRPLVPIPKAPVAAPPANTSSTTESTAK